MAELLSNAVSSISAPMLQEVEVNTGDQTPCYMGSSIVVVGYIYKLKLQAIWVTATAIMFNYFESLIIFMHNLLIALSARIMRYSGDCPHFTK